MMDRLLDNFRSVFQNLSRIRPGAEGASCQHSRLERPRKKRGFCRLRRGMRFRDPGESLPGIRSNFVEQTIHYDALFRS